MAESKTSRVVIVPGNGCTPITTANWYNWLKKSLEKEGVQVSMQDMPDPYEAKQTIWLPFLRDVLKADESPSEAISGYYDRPWLWDKMKGNIGFASQFADKEDCFIPFAEAQVVHKGLDTELIASTRGDHFMVQEFPELLEHIKLKLES
eukprot:CAMPEP_0179491608 /NCGR_PEP_ID=MMETSP0799-20121207/66192_1 /TAXON_ID=46947 /ORGANISM="Geminigera cryophila, Strain CCMP2564" /LENGTH=148 /DNA_ID=CAMNT_0021308097 /DNA_START=42 /DNA_END=489 /DNA_ORIENTATION=-